MSQFARSGANDVLLPTLLDQVTKRPDPVFDFVKHDSQPDS